MALGPSKTHKSTSKITSINYKLIENGKFYGLDHRMVIANISEGLLLPRFGHK